ncbi:hypothetical protein E6C70_14065 [Glaciibacter flavus]|uniref:Uncharacterized protein n=1 Tax=Orlajensenia flava TaxID=2565934 RepID=A0A4S4FL93_9MICO|nr:hypothetical protein [Glaciibacter flavus]THG31180.1 hypothetical protein E6C70_14065 [Glaciibacter flavus]
MIYDGECPSSLTCFADGAVSMTLVLVVAPALVLLATAARLIEDAIPVQPHPESTKGPAH